MEKKFVVVALPLDHTLLKMAVVLFTRPRGVLKCQTSATVSGKTKPIHLIKTQCLDLNFRMECGVRTFFTFQCPTLIFFPLFFHNLQSNRREMPQERSAKMRFSTLCRIASVEYAKLALRLLKHSKAAGCGKKMQTYYRAVA